MRQQFALNLVQLVVLQTRWRKYGLAIGIAVLSYHHVTTAQIFKVVGIGAQGANDRVWVPSSLVLDALAFDRALTQQVGEVDGALAHIHPSDLPTHTFELLNESSYFLENALLFGQVLRIKLSAIVTGEFPF